MKLDMALVRGIDKDEIKQLLCSALVDFGRNTGIGLIAGGIENEEEPETLIRLDVDLGQGYFLGIPQACFSAAVSEKREMIRKYYAKKYIETARCAVYPIIRPLAKPGYTFSPDKKIETVYETLRLNPAITDLLCVNHNMPVDQVSRLAMIIPASI